MSAIVFHCADSGFRSHLAESRSLNLSPLYVPKLNFSPSIESDITPIVPNSKNCYVSRSGELEDGDGFLQVLSLSKKEPLKIEDVYVPPMLKSSSTLSEKSLEVCTESLGCESCTTSPNDSFSSNDSQLHWSMEKKKIRRCKQEDCAIWSVNDSGGYVLRHLRFPPPLTTIKGGLKPLQVNAFREDGRLIVKAVYSPPSPSHFLAERSHGRLCLYWVNHSSHDQSQTV